MHGSVSVEGNWRIRNFIVLDKYSALKSEDPSVVRPTMCKEKHSHGGTRTQGLWGKVISFIRVTIIIRMVFGVLSACLRSETGEGNFKAK